MKAILLFLSIFIVMSCVDSGLPPVSTLAGTVRLFDEYGYKHNDASGIRITINNIGTKNYGLSGKSGHFELLTLPPGTFDISFNKPGYGTFWLFQVKHGQRNTLLDTVNLYQNSSTIVSDLKAVFDTGFNQYIITGHISALQQNKTRWIRLFIGSNQSVSSTAYAYTPPSLFMIDKIDFSVFISKEEISALGITKGDPFYIIAYGSNETVSTYFDPYLKLNQFPALSPTASNVAECFAQ